MPRTESPISKIKSSTSCAFYIRFHHRLGNQTPADNRPQLAFAQGRGKLIMLLAGMHEIRNILKQLSREILRIRFSSSCPDDATTRAGVAYLALDPNG
jgi:hypothetical protein